MADSWKLTAFGDKATIQAALLAQEDALEIRLVGPVGALGPRAGVGVVVEHPRHALSRQHPQVFDVGDHGHFFFSCARNASGSPPPRLE